MLPLNLYTRSGGRRLAVRHLRLSTAPVGAGGGTVNPPTEPETPPRPKHLFLIAGQSNATSYADWDGGADYPADAYQIQRFDPLDPVEDQPAENFVAPEDAIIIPASRPLHHQSPTFPGSMGFSLQFAIDYLSDNPGVDLVFMPGAYQSSGFQNNDWNPGDIRYEDAVARTNAALAKYPEMELKGILWHQGEADATDATDAANYKTRLYTMIEAIRADITGADETTPFVTGGMVPEYVASLGAPGAEVQGVLQGIADEVLYTEFASSDGLTGMEEVGGTSWRWVHFDGPSHRILGSRYYNSWQVAVENDVLPEPAPNPQQPYPGPDAPVLSPGGSVYVTAANYDTGGQGIAYNDEAGLQGTQYGVVDGGREGDVDLFPTENGVCIALTQPDEFVEYSVDVEQAGTYTLAYDTANDERHSRDMRFVVFDEQGSIPHYETGDVPVANTGDWNTPATLTTTVELNAGRQVIRAVFEGGTNYYGFTLSGPI